MTSPATETTLTVEPKNEGDRLDSFLASQLAMARNQVSGWIRLGIVSVNGQIARRSRKLRSGDRVQLNQAALDAKRPEQLVAEPWPDSIPILDQTEDFVVINKPADLVVHPGAGHTTGTLAHFLVDRWPEMARIGHEQRPGIVHRLDVGTTGVMVLARSEVGFQSLSLGFAERRVDKAYLALVYGAVSSPLEIELPIGRHPAERKKMAIRRNGRPAHSSVSPIATTANGQVSLVAVRLHTGRTHQIRVHLKAAKHPLVGDPTYGEARWKPLPSRYHRPLSRFPRPALHAWRLRFADPVSGTLRSYEASPAGDLERLWNTLADNGNVGAGDAGEFKAALESYPSNELSSVIGRP